MLFIKCDELKPGMRLAKPIYSKKGVLLYDRATVLKDEQAISNIKSFGLIGIFVLEPAEPVPPMTQEDLEFEKFQTVTYNQIMDEMGRILAKHKQEQFPHICAEIIRNYGNLSKKINFQQSLRSEDDYIYKHGLNVAILAAMMTHSMNVPLSDQNDAVMAAVIHDIGKLTLPPQMQSKDELTYDERMIVDTHQQAGYDIIEEAFSFQPNVRRACNQSRKTLLDYDNGDPIQNMKLITASKVLTVADYFDKKTAVRLDSAPVSEVVVIRNMNERPDVFDPRVIRALLDSINILLPGASIELNTGEKALVIRTNERDVLRPTILSFRDNKIIDLSDKKFYGNLEIVDIMKTMDNRYVMDTDKMKSLGFDVEEPDYV